MVNFKAGALCKREKCGHSWYRKTAKRVVHVRQPKTRNAMERDGLVSSAWLRGLRHTKQNKSRSAENDPNTHDEIEKSVENERRRRSKGDPVRL
jgi:hypothetical protein